MTDKKSAPKAKTPATSAAPKGLGKGLSALLGDNAAIASMSSTPATGTTKPQAKAGAAAKNDIAATTPSAGGAQNIAIDLIVASPYQPRVMFDEDSLSDLTDSITSHGVVQPLLVRPIGGKYELIAGERRWRAAQKAGLHDVPVVIRDADDQMAAEIAMIENIQRHDLSIIEEAEGYRRLIEDFKYTQDALAGVIGKSRSHLANTMRLLNLPQTVRDMLGKGVLTAGQVRPLIGRDDAAELALIVQQKGMSARQVEQLAAKADKPARPKAEKPSDLVALERELAEQTGFDITISFNPYQEKGSVTIKANNLDQFDAIITTLKD